MTQPLSAQEVAKFLQENPEFMVDHADVFSALEVPHPHQASAISLGERQIMTLRDRLRDFEFRFAQLVRNAALNETTTSKLIEASHCRSASPSTNDSTTTPPGTASAPSNTTPMTTYIIIPLFFGAGSSSAY